MNETHVCIAVLTMLLLSLPSALSIKSGVSHIGWEIEAVCIIDDNFYLFIIRSAEIIYLFK